MNEVKLGGKLWRAYVGETKGRKWAFFTVAVESGVDREGQPTSEFIGCRASGDMTDMLKDLPQGKGTDTKLKVLGAIKSSPKKDKSKQYVLDTTGNKIYETYVDVKEVSLDTPAAKVAGTKAAF